MVEAFLRLQQRLGPLVDLELNSLNLEYTFSEELNHIPTKAHNVMFHLLGERIERYYDENGIRIESARPLPEKPQEAFKVLFMGDSYMQGYGDHHTIPQHIWEYFNEKDFYIKNLLLLNAGCSSYSPLIFIPQAKKLIPRLKPDFVVIDIDETDLIDDCLRYRNLAIRDEAGKIIAVRSSPIHRKWVEGMLGIRKYPLYTLRLFAKIIHIRVYIPIVRRTYGKSTNALIYSKDRDKYANKKYAEEIKFFEQNVAELMGTLITLMEDKRRILVLYHPHLGHIKPEKDGFYWNTFVSDAVRKVTTAHGVSFYDATEDFKKAFGDKPEQYYLPHNDPHLNYNGLRIYGRLVAEKLEEKLKDLFPGLDREALDGVE